MKILNDLCTADMLSPSFFEEAKSGAWYHFQRIFVVKIEDGRYATILADWFERIMQAVCSLWGHDYFSRTFYGQRVTILSKDDIEVLEKKMLNPAIPKPKVSEENAPPPQPAAPPILKPPPVTPTPEASNPVPDAVPTPTVTKPVPPNPASQFNFEEQYLLAVKNSALTQFVEKLEKVLQPNKDVEIDYKSLERLEIVLKKQATLADLINLRRATSLANPVNENYIKELQDTIDEVLYDKCDMCVIATGEKNALHYNFIPRIALETLRDLRSIKSLFHLLNLYDEVKCLQNEIYNETQPLTNLNADKELFLDLARAYSVQDSFSEAFADYLRPHIQECDPDMLKELVKREMKTERRALLILLTQSQAGRPVEDLTFCVKALFANTYAGSEEEFKPEEFPLKIAFHEMSKENERKFFEELLGNEALTNSLMQDKEGRIVLSYINSYSKSRSFATKAAVI